MNATATLKKDTKVCSPKAIISNFNELAECLGLTMCQLKQILGDSSTKEISDWLQHCSNKEEKQQKIAVVDCSIVGVYGFLNYIKQNFDKVIITNITANELNNLKEDKTQKNWAAAQALLDDVVADNNQQFYIQNVNIERLWNYDTGKYDNDKSIVQYCEENRQSVILVSADAGQIFRARNCGIKTVFLDQIDTAELTHISLDPYMGTKLLSSSELKGDNYALLIRDISGNLIKEFPYEVTEGDDIFLLTRENSRGKKVTVFKYIRVTNISSSSVNGGIIKKILFKDTDKIKLYNFGSLKDDLELFVNNFRASFKKENR